MEDLRNKYNVICPRAKGGYLEQAPSEIFEFPDEWILEPKIDGERVSFQIGEERSLLIGRNRQDQLKGVGRAGEFRNLGHKNPYLAALKSKQCAGTMFDGELTEAYKSDKTYSKTTLKRIKAGRFIGYSVWQVLFYRGKDVRHLTEQERWKLAIQEVWKINKLKAGKKIRVVERRNATKENLLCFFDQGLEGAIAKRLDVPLPMDKRTNPNWWKLKGDKNRTVDAFVIGVTEKKSGGSGIRGIKPKTNGMAATFTVGMLDKKGKIIEVGKMGNLPDAVKVKGFKNFKEYKGRVAEMIVSGWGGESFRFPRYVKWRKDKGRKDCMFEEQVGGKK